MRQAMIQRQPSFYSTYFNIALCHSAVNVFLKGQIIKDVDDFFVKGIIDVILEWIWKYGDFPGSDLISSTADQKSNKKNVE